MNLYHGTSQSNANCSQSNANCIEEEGFLGSELSDLTDGFSHVEDGVVFLTEDIDEAREYGEAVVQVHPEGISIHPFSDGNTDHFYAVAEEINQQSWWEIVE